MLSTLPSLVSNPNATVHSVEELNALDSTIETIIVDSNGCNDRSFTVLNLTRFVNLKVFEVGDYKQTKQTNKQNVNGKPAGLFLPEGPAPFAHTPLLSKRP